MALPLRLAAPVALAYPALVPALIYGNWLVACIALGRIPRPYLDDPKHIGEVSSVVHWLSVWGLAGGFYLFWSAAVVLLIGLLWPDQTQRRRLGLQLGSSLLGFAVIYGWVHLDPGRVVEWYFD